MMSCSRGVFLAVITLLASSSTADAAFLVFTDKTSFLGTTGAVDATGPLPTTGFIGTAGGATPGPGTTVGSVTFQAVRYIFSDFSARLPGNELGISFGADGNGNNDSLDLSVAAPVFSLGFDFVEPQFDPNVNSPFVDSLFTVTVKNNAAILFTFTFNAPNDTAAFIGVAGDVLFNRIEIRETIGTDDNEFYGRVFTGTRAVPEPTSLALLGAGALALCGSARRGRRLRRAGQSG